MTNRTARRRTTRRGRAGASIVAAVLAALAVSPAAWAVSGGESLDDSGAPYVAYLGNCTGTLIAPDRVLTAAHCLDGVDPQNGRVVIGTDMVGGNKGFVNGVLTPVQPPASAVYPIKGVVSNPGFALRFPFAHKRPQNAIADNDVGYIVLARPVLGIAPIPIATAADDTALTLPGSPVTLVGYGDTQPPPAKSSFASYMPALHTGDLSLIAASTCRRAYPEVVDGTREVCAQDLTAGPLTQPCAGDSGGPLIAHGPGGPVQIGVTSWGSEVKDQLCGQAHLPAVWMRVSDYARFITDPTPTFEPFTHERPKVTGTHRLTCHAPRFQGSPAKVGYRWGIANYRGQLTNNLPHPLTPLKGATSRTFTPTRATHGKAIACAVTARNGGGSWTAYSASIRR